MKIFTHPDNIYMVQYRKYLHTLVLKLNINSTQSIRRNSVSRYVSFSIEFNDIICLAFVHKNITERIFLTDLLGIA